MKEYYRPTQNRLAKMDYIINLIMVKAAFIDDKKSVHPYVLDVLQSYSKVFEARMKTLMQELEKYKEG